MPVTSALRRWRQEDKKFKVILSCLPIKSDANLEFLSNCSGREEKKEKEGKKRRERGEKRVEKRGKGERIVPKVV